MAEDEPKARARRKRPAAKKSPAEPASKAASGSPPKTGAAANREDRSPASDEAPRRPLHRGLVGGLAAVAVIGAVILSWPGAWDRLAAVFSGPEQAAPSPEPKPAPWTELAGRLGALERSVAEMGADIAALKAAPPPAREDDGASLRAVEERLAALASSVEAIEGGLAKPAAPPQESGTVALMALAGALRHGAPFAPLAARVGGDLDAGEGKLTGDLEGLAGYAAQGVPTRVALAARLEALPLSPGKTGSPPQEAAPEPQRQAGFWDKVKSNFFGLVEIRRTAGDKSSGPDPAARARAATAHALAKGDLAAALQASAGLAGAEAETWRKDLGARIAADRLALALYKAVAERLGPKAANP